MTQPSNNAPHYDPILQPDLAALYQTRAARLRHLAIGHDLEDYLNLAATLTDAQSECLKNAPDAPLTTPDPIIIANSGTWLPHLDHLLAAGMDMKQTDAFTKLAQLSENDKRDAVIALAHGRFDAVEPAFAPILWAALSLETARAARSTPLPPPTMAESACCPICGTAPAASIIHSGDRQGLRYLHCTLCECEWHMVRAKCSNCGDSKHLDYLSFDTTEATVRAESCGACHGYLKIVSHERDHHAEVIADDLVSLLLDDAAMAEGYARSGFNPWALPGE